MIQNDNIQGFDIYLLRKRWLEVGEGGLDICIEGH